MELLNVLLVSVLSFIVLFILTKLLKNKQMSELNMFDYIIGISIGSIAAEMATSLEDDAIKPLIAMTVYALLAVLFAIVGNKSLALRRLLVGKSLVLFDKGMFFRENFRKARLDINEFLTQCRVNGYYSLADVETAVFEPNGKLSVLPKAYRRPCNAEDLGVPVKSERPGVIVLSDGKVLSGNLSAVGRDERWLDNELKKLKLGRKNVFLAVMENDKLTVYERHTEKPDRDIFQ